MTLGCAAATQARAESFFEMEAGLGTSHYDTRGDGIWYQSGSPQNSLHLNFPAYMAGVNFRLYENERFGVRAHIDYVNLGHVSAHCECTEDANYNLRTHTVINPSIPTANLTGFGGAQGIKLTLEPYVMWRGWHLGVEGGLFPYRPDWRVSAFWHLDESTHIYETPHGIQWGKVIGANIQRGNFGVTFAHYFLPNRYSDSASPALYSGANVLMLTVNTNGLF